MGLMDDEAGFVKTKILRVGEVELTQRMPSFRRGDYSRLKRKGLGLGLLHIR